MPTVDESEWYEGAGKWYVRIDRWHPARLNQLINVHWATAARRKKHDAQIVALSVAGAGVPKAESKRRVSLEITLAPRQRAGDPDAYWKSLLDSLVHCGALRNDSHVWLELGGITFARGPIASTVICLENVQFSRGEGFIANAVQRDSKKRHRAHLGEVGRSRRLAR